MYIDPITGQLMMRWYVFCGLFVLILLWLFVELTTIAKRDTYQLPIIVEEDKDDDEDEDDDE